MTLTEEFKKPFNLVTLMLTIISLVLTLMFYYNGKKEKKISYQLIEPTSLVFDSKNSSSKIRLFEKDSVLITDNVYLQTGTIWNSGDFPISKSDLRKQLTLNFSSAKRILDFKIIKQNDATIANFKLDQLNEKSLKINWDYFDPTYGFVFQVIYIGEDNPKFELLGKILDIPNFTKVKQDEKIDKRLWLGLIAVYSLMTIFLVWRNYELKKRRGRFDKMHLFILTGTVLLLSYMLIFKIFTNSNMPI